MEPKNYGIQSDVLGKIKFQYVGLFFYLAVTFFIVSCDDEPSGLTNDIKAELNILSLEYFPDDSIACYFKIDIPKDSKSYSIEWTAPDTLIGWGPFLLQILENVKIEGVIIDSIGNTSNFYYLILKDTIDCNKFDYRNKYLSEYSCDVVYKWATEDPQIPGSYITHQESYKDTISVTKPSDFEKLKIDYIFEVDFNFQSGKFSGYHISGEITDSSVQFYTFDTPAALRNWTFVGRRLHF